MKPSVSVTISLLAALLCATLARAADAPGWIERSNANAAPLLEIFARYIPEQAAGLGVEGHDQDIFDLNPGYDTRMEADLAAAAGDFQARLAAEQDPRLRQDLQILLTAAEEQKASSALNRRLMLPYFDLPEALFQGFHSLLDPRVAKERYPAALVRLSKYTGPDVRTLRGGRTHRAVDGRGRAGPGKPVAIRRGHP
jgi:hypothetical protein